jgi:uncharacterized protein YdhG (YjbR/CyaY superfamily)
MDKPNSVEEYLAAVPEDQRAALERLRATIREAAPEATEAISYSMPAFKDHGRALVGYAAFTEHCSLFPMNADLIERLADDLKGFRTSKGTIRFTVDRPLPKALVRKIVKARLEENAARGRRR